MSLDVGDTINKLSDSFLKAPLVHTIARNPIYTALMITFIIMIVIMMVFRDAETEETVLTMSFRAGFWIFLMMLGALFLHNRVLGFELDTVAKEKAYGGVFSDVTYIEGDDD